jgi:hypothetical protein
LSLLPRLLGSLSLAVAFAATASPALADSSVTFPATTVEITDPGAASDTVNLTGSATDPADLENTHVFLGGDTLAPYTAIGVDGVRDARYAAADDHDVDGELSTETCAVYNGSQLEAGAPVTVAEDGASFSAELPKGEVISFESTGVAVGIEGTDTACANEGFDGLEVDYVNSHQTIDGFTWSAPAAPVVTDVAGGRRQVALSFDQQPGTQYDIYRAGEDTPFAANIRGDGDAVQVVLDEDADGQPLTPGTEYAFQVKATRLFNIWQGEDMIQPASPLSAVATATTAAVQVVQFTAAPAESTTDRNARFSWSISGNDAGESPFCVLDMTEISGTEIPCSATGAAIDGVTVGAHTLTVFPADGEGTYNRSWTVTAAPAAASAPAATTPVAPVAKPVVVKADPDGDGIENTWLIAGKAAPSPAAPKASVSGGNVKLKLGKPVKNAKKVRVFRAKGKGAYKLVKTLGSKTAAFTDRSVKRGVTYSYKTVAVNAKGQQSKASAKTVVKVKKA